LCVDIFFNNYGREVTIKTIKIEVLKVEIKYFLQNAGRKGMHNKIMQKCFKRA
jgi:hypothetical protein